LYVREISRLIKEDPTNVSRELDKLKHEGVFVSEKKGVQKYYSLNPNYPLMAELRSIVSKTIGIEHELAAVIKKTSGLDAAFIYGSYARGEDSGESDIDLFIIGKPGVDALVAQLNKAEKKIGREINYRLYSREDFKKAWHEKNSFVISVLKNRKIFLKGDESGIAKIKK
jgi:predicted nucleotidyltransferase